MRLWLWRLAVLYLKPPPKPLTKPEVGDVVFDDMRSTGTYVGTVTFPSPAKSTDATSYALLMASLWNIRHAEDAGLHGLVRSSTFRYTVKFEVAYEAVEDTDAMTMDPDSLHKFVDLLAAAAHGYVDEGEDECEDEDGDDYDPDERPPDQFGDQDAESGEPVQSIARHLTLVQSGDDS